MRNTVVIMGSHPETRKHFDWNTDADIWVFNEAGAIPDMKRFDAVFQLHVPAIFRNPKNRNDPNHYEWLKSTTIPVYMQEQYPDIPASIKYPHEAVLAQVCMVVNDKPFGEATCSISWALALAIYLGYKNIEVYGVELNSATEYFYQQSNFKFWLGFAAGKGINVKIYTSMFESFQYGYDSEVAIPAEVFSKRITELTPEFELSKASINPTKTTLSELMQSLWDNDNSHEIVKAVQKMLDVTGRSAFIEGQIVENKRYDDKLQAMIAESSDFAFARQEFEQAAGLEQKSAKEYEGQLKLSQARLADMHDHVIKAQKGSPKRSKLVKGYLSELNRFLSLNAIISAYNGRIQENRTYLARLERGIKAAGGEKSEQAILGG